MSAALIWSVNLEENRSDPQFNIDPFSTEDEGCGEREIDEKQME